MNKAISEFEVAVSAHVDQLTQSSIDVLREAYSSDQMVVIENMLPSHISSEIEFEAKRLIAELGTRRELVIEQSGSTPRAYTSVGRNYIRDKGFYIPAFFDSPSILQFLSRITEEPLYRVPYEPEEFIINSQHRPGDTHGWHWDDYAFALIWVVEEPDVFSGGRVEFVPRTIWRKANTKSWLEEILRTEKVISKHISKGQCYLLRAKDVLHRITPLTEGTTRTVIVFTYATESDLIDPDISHESMEAIYPVDTGPNLLAPHLPPSE